MARITVLRPDLDLDDRPVAPLAPRRPLPDTPLLTLIENGKPKARQLLELLAERLRPRLGDLAVETFSKPSAAKPISADEARLMAARSHLVITGLGD